MNLSPRIGILALATVMVVGLLVVSPGAAAKPRKGYCSPTGDYCISATRNKAGDVRLWIGTFSFRGRYLLCVTAPKGATGDRKVCKRFRLRRQATLNVSNVSWRRNFPDKGPGLYQVSWWKGGYQIGPMLGFKP